MNAYFLRFSCFLSTFLFSEPAPKLLFLCLIQLIFKSLLTSILIILLNLQVWICISSLYCEYFKLFIFASIQWENELFFFSSSSRFYDTIHLCKSIEIIIIWLSELYCLNLWHKTWVTLMTWMIEIQINCLILIINLDIWIIIIWFYCYQYKMAKELVDRLREFPKHTIAECI